MSALKKLERKTGIEPAALALARRCSTAEPLPHKMAGDLGFEPRHDGVKVRCLTAWLIPNKNAICFGNNGAIDGT